MHLDIPHDSDFASVLVS